MTAFIPINEPCTDSLTLSIPEEQITVIDPILISRVKTFYVDIGENGMIDDMEEVLPPKPYPVQKNGVTLRFSWVNFPHPTGVSKRYLNITLTAKCLTTRYFEGLTNTNIVHAYNFIMSFGVFSVSYDDFLNGTVYDIDICINHRLHVDDFYKSIEKLYASAGPTKQRFFNPIKRENKFGKIFNCGLDINSRRGAKPSTPYFKMYAKDLELLSKSAEFYNHYLFGSDIKNLVRSEFTIKSSRHKQRLYKLVKLPEFKTLKEYLKIPKKALKRAHDSALPSYLMPKIGRVKIKGLSPLDTALSILVQRCIEKGDDYETILMMCIGNYDGTQKARLKTKLNRIFEHIETNNLEASKLNKLNRRINDFLTVGLNLEGRL